MFNPENQLEQPKKPTDWDILGIQEGSSPDEIKVAYRKAVKEVHPDAKKAGGEEAFRQINEAYKRLLDEANKPEKPKPDSTDSVAAEAAQKYGKTRDDWEKEKKKDPFDENDPDKKIDLYG